MHAFPFLFSLESSESIQETRVGRAPSYASSNRYASSVLSKLSACITTQCNARLSF